jgi:hypothetical protein
MGAVLRRGYRHVIPRLRKFEIEKSYNTIIRRTDSQSVPVLCMAVI